MNRMSVKREYLKRGRLAKLYDILEKRAYVESGKIDVFISIFEQFNYDLSEQLPIKWTCPPKFSDSNDETSNLTLLYYLISALRDKETFFKVTNRTNSESETIKKSTKEILTSHDRDLITKYFCHSQGEKILKESLHIGNNKNAVAIVKEILIECGVLV